MTAEGSASEIRPRRRISARGAGLALAFAGVAGLVLASFVVGLGRDPTVIRSPLVDRPAPPLSGPTLDSGAFDLSALAGKVRIVNFWASWCVQCRREHPGFVRVAQQYRDAPVAIVGVIYQDDPGAARSYMREMGGDWPSVLDPDGRIAIDYGVYGVPETFLVDAGGVVRAKVVGPIDEATLRAWIDAELERIPGG